MRLRLSRLHYPVTALGPGRRIGIWLQGCTVGCRGCISRDTWEADDAMLVPLDDVVDWCGEARAEPVGGVTISGGEPSEQPAALEALVAALRVVPGWDLLCYTGVEEDEFARRVPSVYAQLDAIVTGPYQAEQPTDLVWRGSANQRLVPLSRLGHERYDRWVDARTDQPMIQIYVDEAEVRMIGVPRAGDIQRLDRRLRAQGIRLGGASWRP